MYEEVPNHWTEELVNPFGPIQDIIEEKCDEEEFIFYSAFNGFSNQLQAINVAMRIAYSTNRTLIIPPLLPHFTAKQSGYFHGRDIFKLSFDPADFPRQVEFSTRDVAHVRSLSSRAEFPSWQEVLDFNEVSKRTGVRLIDLYDFVKSKSNACMYEFLRQPIPVVSIQEMTGKSKTWGEFIKRFKKQFYHHNIALLGDVFSLDHYDSELFESHNRMFAQYNNTARLQISDGIHSMALSAKALELLKAALAHLPNDYAAVHIRAGDSEDEQIQTCNDEVVVTEYNKLIDNIQESGASEGSTIYIASNDGRAKECFNEISQNKYSLLNLDDVFELDSLILESKMQEILDEMTIDESTKLLLLDILLVSLGSKVHFAMINFPMGYSSFQKLINTLHDKRDQRLKQLGELNVV